MITLEAESAESYLDAGKMSSRLKKAQRELKALLSSEIPGSDMLGWLNLPYASERQIQTISDVGKRIQDENDCLVVIGIGGSYLGARAAIEALPDEASFPVFFAGNSLSPDYHERLLRRLEGRKFAICVISKSGTTTETAIAFRIFKKKLVELLGKKDATRRIVAVTDPERGALRRMAEEEEMLSFPIPADVGGRFSVLSSVGLVPLAASGISALELLDGARGAMDRYTAGGGSNIMLRYAALRQLLHNQGTMIEVLSTFHPELDTFCEWWKQLAGESEGKGGNGLFPASAVMTTDLHSLGQLLQEGTRRILETFLVAERPRREMEVPGDDENLDGLNYLAGMPMSDINLKAYQGTKEAHIGGGIPVISITIPSITAHSLGQLFVFFELSVAVSGLLLGVNPFNQPGVEEYKCRMFRLLGKPQ